MCAHRPGAPVRDYSGTTGAPFIGEQAPMTSVATPREGMQHSTSERELYDLARDPYQLDSRHADPALASVRLQLERELARLRNCRGATCY